MVGQERWEEIRRLYCEQGWNVSQIARSLELDRKTVRQCLRQEAWQPYRRDPAAETLLATHTDCLRERAAVQYSARILFQELRHHRDYRGSYETVKRFVALRHELQARAEFTRTRFETPPGQQSQIDWAESQVPFRLSRRKVHFFVLALGYSRRAFYSAAADERLSRLRDAHERAVEHFGDDTREHLYDQPRTIC